MAAHPLITYYLGRLVGSTWDQYSNSIGQIYYYDPNTLVEDYHLPNGWEDAITDQWIRDPTQTWPQWNNTRTGRARLDDPNPPPPQTYLDVDYIIARLTTVQRDPDSEEAYYRRVLSAVLQWLFTIEEGFSVIQEDLAGKLRPDFTIFKLLHRPQGSGYEFEFLFAESKRLGEPWGSTEEHLQTACASTGNDVPNIYAMIQIGLKVKLYKLQDGIFSVLTGKLDLVDDVQDVIWWATYIKEHPLKAID